MPTEPSIPNGWKTNRYYNIVPVKCNFKGTAEHMNFFIDAPDGKEFPNKQNIIQFFKIPEQLRPAISVRDAYVYPRVSHEVYPENINPQNWEKYKKSGEFRGNKISDFGITEGF